MKQFIPFLLLILPAALIAGRSDTSAVRLASEFQRQHNYPASLDQYNRALAADNQNAVLYYSRGMVELNLRQFDDARRDFSIALALQPSLADAYYQRAMCHLSMKNTSLAVSDFKSAIERRSMLSASHEGLGRCYQLEKHDSLAMIEYSVSLKLDPRNANACYQLAALCHQHRQDAEALAWLERLDMIAPSSDGYLLRATIRYTRKDYSGAANDFSKVIAEKPGNAAVITERGICYMLMGRDQLAAADLSSAIRLSPSLGRAWHYLGMLKNFQGDKNAACSDFQQALHLGYARSEAELKKLNCRIDQ